MIRKVGIIGLGGVGAMYGSMLLRALGEGNVLGICGTERAKRLRRDGIFVNGERQAFRIVTPEEAQPLDLLIFTVKYYSLKDAMELAEPFLTEDTIVMSFLNGVISEQDIQDRLHPKHLLYTTVQGMDVIKVGNQITMEHTGYIAFNTVRKDGSCSAAEEDVHAVIELLEKAGIAYQNPDDIMRQIYSKWMLNVGVNQTCAVYADGYRIVQTGGSHHEIFRSVMEEARLCANAEGIALTEDDMDYWAGVMDGLSPDSEPSMRQDTRAGRPTEVGLFGETVLALGRKHGIPTPMNEEYVRVLKTL